MSVCPAFAMRVVGFAPAAASLGDRGVPEIVEGPDYSSIPAAASASLSAFQNVFPR
jgi:hypothetical protein